MNIIPKGTKIHVGYETGYVGEGHRSNFILSRDYTEEELDDELWMRAKDHAEMYGIYPACEYDEIPEDDEESYSDNIDGWWEYYDEKKHAGYTYSNCPEFEEF